MNTVQATPLNHQLELDGMLMKNVTRNIYFLNLA